MVLVFIEPRVASLRKFRCFACGDMRSIEQKNNQAAELRPSFFD